MRRDTDAGFEEVWAETNGHAPVGEVGELLSQVVPERVSWLWPGRIPLGKVTVLDGDPGLGKSAVTTDLAARVSAGRSLPDGTPCEAAGVVLSSAEDGLADTIRPRLDAAGGDPERVLALGTVPDGDSERIISIPEDLDIIGRGIERVEAKLVIVDPLMAFLSGEVNSHRDQDVRRALAPLARLAEETGAAVVIVRHLNKSPGGNPLYRGGGSIGIVGAARSAMLVAKDPEDERRRVLANLKSNLAPPAPSLAFVLRGAANGAVRVEWKGESAHSADDLLSAPTDPEERTALEDAMEFIRDELSGFPVAAKQVLKDAREAGISERTLHRAKKALGVRSVREADGSWTWVLPKGGGPEEGKVATEPLSGNVGNVRKVATDGGENSPCLSLDCQGCQGCQDDQAAHAGKEGDRGEPTPLSSDLRPGESATLEELEKRRLEQEERAAIIEVLDNPEYYRAPALVLAEYRNGKATLDRLTRSVLAALKIDFGECGRYRPLVEEALQKEEDE